MRKLTIRVNSTREYFFRAIARKAAAKEHNSTFSTDQDEDVQTKQCYAGKKALVVGSGPAGSVAASFLAKQGFHVDVYEKRKDPVKFETVPDRSISLVLSTETASVMRKVGIELPSQDEGYVNGIHPFLGASFHTPNGEVLSLSEQSRRFLAERHDLAKHLMDTVRKKNPEVTFHFEHSCDGVNLAKQEARFQDKDNKYVKQNYDLLVGADGANSEVRRAMQEQIHNFKVSTTPQFVFYKSYRDVIVDVDRVPKKYKKFFEPGYVAFFRAAKSKSCIEGLRLISFFRVASGTLSGSMSGTRPGFDSIISQEKEYLNEALADDFPKEWIDQMVPALVDNPLHELPSIIEVSSLVGPNVVLIGDAGHSVSPVIGIGCNMAVQDGQALNDALQSAEGYIEAALEEFNNVRLKQVKECQQLEKFAFAAVGDRKIVNQLLILFAKMHHLYHFIGNRYLPQLISKPATLRFGTQEISAKKALQILQIELASLLVVFAIILFGFFKTIGSVL